MAICHLPVAVWSWINNRYSHYPELKISSNIMGIIIVDEWHGGGSHSYKKTEEDVRTDRKTGRVISYVLWNVKNERDNRTGST
jgi:hypothetical protein